MSLIKPDFYLHTQALGRCARVWVTQKDAPWLVDSEGQGLNGSANSITYAGNLAKHVADDVSRVDARRHQLMEYLGRPVQWLNQVHGTAVFDATEVSSDAPPHMNAPTADACVSRSAATVLGVLTADCLPVMLASNDGTAVAAAHAGWRGLNAGVLVNTYTALRERSGNSAIHAFIGPGISAAQFEIGPEVREAFLDAWPAVATAFTPLLQGAGKIQKYLCDLELIARWQLQALGVAGVTGGGWCTVSDIRLHSYRRSARVAQASGRFATLVGLSV